MRRFFTFAALTLALVALPAAADDSWTRFGGPNGDFELNHIDLAAQWPQAGPSVLWQKPLGAGYSGIVTDGEVLYTLFRDGDDDVVIALQAADGAKIWQERYSAPARKENVTQFGAGPHATPLLVGDRLYTLGYTGVFQALDRKTGKRLWHHDLVDDLGGAVQSFGYSASPIEYDGKIVVLVGGEKYGVAAFEPTDGSIVWSSAPTSVSYATPIVIDVEGQTQLLYYASDALIGIDPANGDHLWRFEVKNGYENHASMPIWGDDGLLWVATQQDGATRVLRLTRQDGKTTTEQLWYNNKIRIHHWNALRIDDVVYAGIGDGVQLLAGVDIKTGEVLWRERGYEKPSLLQVGDKTLVLTGDGKLSLIAMSPEGVKTLGEAELFDDVTWAAPTLVGTRMYVRDKKTIRAYDLAAAEPTS